MKNYTLKLLRIIPIVCIGFFSLSVNAQKDNSNNLLEGKWNVVFPETNFGEYRINLIFETKSNTFNAYTRKNVLKDLFGSIKSKFIKKVIKSVSDGSLVKITNGTTYLKNDTLFIKGTYSDVLKIVIC